ncbi:MAG: hypothetical protein ACYTG4_03565 [Planctomycetota bacterium]|jgi:hypothetical protein
MRRSLILGLASVAVMAFATAAVADGLRWKLNFNHETPTWVRIPAAEGRTRVSWFMQYTVENKSGDTRKPLVRIEAHTDTKKVYRDSNDPRTMKAAKKKLKNDKLKSSWSLRKGVADGAKVNCIAAFGAVDDLAKQMEVRVYGLEDTVNQIDGKKYNEVRYWKAVYTRKGDEFKRTEDNWKLKSSGWVTEKNDELPAVEK